MTQLQQRAGAGVSKASLAREFGVSRETVYQYLADRTLRVVAWGVDASRVPRVHSGGAIADPRVRRALMSSLTSP